jgi:hypothetical protein
MAAMVTTGPEGGDMSRSKSAQSRHDTEVRRIAESLQRRGYDVAADVPGFPRPETIRGYRPDVVASKGTERRIVEVETPDSLDTARDLAQQKAFRETADRSKNTVFRRTVTE